MTTMPRHLRCSRRQRRQAGFNLMEVLIAMGIFAIGFTAVGALFPVAAVLQRETLDDAVSQQVARSARATVMGRHLRVKPGQSDGLDQKQRLAQSPIFGGGLADPDLLCVLPLHPDLMARWPLADRSSPTTTANPGSRRYFWVPLVRRMEDPSPLTEPDANLRFTPRDKWQVFIFILRRDQSTYPTFPDTPWVNDAGNSSLPHVVSVAVTVPGDAPSRLNFNNDRYTNGTAGTGADGKPDQVLAGDEILDNNGTIYSVVQADAKGVVVSGMVVTHPVTGKPPSRLYYGQPGVTSVSSPTRRVILLPNTLDVATVED